MRVSHHFSCIASELQSCMLWAHGVFPFLLFSVVMWAKMKFPLSLQIESLSLTFHGHDLIVDSELELNYGRSVVLD